MTRKDTNPCSKIKTIQITNKLGRKYLLESGDAFYEQRFKSGPYQGRNLKFVRKTVPNARIIIDVGMNVANNTIEYSTWAKTVVGFEPFTPIFNIGKQNIETNKALNGTHNGTVGWHKEDGKFASLNMIAQIDINNVGLGTENKTMKLLIHPKNMGHNNILIPKMKTKYDTINVKIRTLDSYNLKDVDFIKVDTEGYEFFTLKGGINTIEKYRPLVQVEAVEAQYKKYNYTPQDLIDFFLKEIGDYYFCDYRGTNLGTKWTKIKGVMDYFFVPSHFFKTQQGRLDKWFKNNEV